MKELREIVREMMIAKEIKNQTKFGALVGASQTMVSDMLRAGSTWQRHFEVIMRILRYALKLDLITANDLMLPRQHDDQQPDTGASKTGQVSLGQGRKKRVKTHRS